MTKNQVANLLSPSSKNSKKEEASQTGSHLIDSSSDDRRSRRGGENIEYLELKAEDVNIQSESGAKGEEAASDTTPKSAQVNVNTFFDDQ